MVDAITIGKLWDAYRAMQDGHRVVAMAPTEARSLYSMTPTYGSALTPEQVHRATEATRRRGYLAPRYFANNSVVWSTLPIPKPIEEITLEFT